MSLNPEGTRLYQQRLTAVTDAMKSLPQPIVKGRACALGTLAAILKRVENLLTVWETRAMTEADLRQVSQDASTLEWLLKDTAADFEGVYFGLPEMSAKLSFVEAMEAIRISLQEATKV
ncbi:hypothetical protein [Asticcacaulis machinosus]|uniref:Uncharacterized protein n=1 Tax=Asticcacaulis machinosus TaxID=2984211 RepID=A0ABT5HGI5_9CAUL|nr:hypothetical protein [Asticcacaulis machinosus]MDC7675206.1 hypothetical protein [Asticcacaulis machinosus]